MKKQSLLVLILLATYLPNTIACTSFGFISKTGTVIAKNSDYYYDNQSVEVLVPNKQFALWYNNTYGNNFKVFAQIANNNVKMGINEAGLTAMEEDPLLPKDRNHRRYMQPLGGTAECMTLWGILQNFKTVDQIIPYLDNIFCHASPNHYEISDAHKILVVEVAYGDNDTSMTRKFSYKVLSNPGDDYTHTNTYQDPKFVYLNKISASLYSTHGAEARNTRIKSLLASSNRSESNVLSWLLDTTSSSNNPNDNNWCLGTSIFRSNLGKKTEIDNERLHPDTYGTVASMVVFNNGTPHNTDVIIRIIDRIKIDKHGNQTVYYKEMKALLPALFAKSYKFTEKQFTRLAPMNGICK